MPIYDYVCSNCATRTEFIHGIDAPQPRFCPACGAEDTLRKAFVAPTVHFKGSGWAKKDRSASSAAKLKAATGDGAEGKGDAKSDSKGDARGDGKGGSPDAAGGGKAGGTPSPAPSSSDAAAGGSKQAASSTGEA